MKKMTVKDIITIVILSVLMIVLSHGIGAVLSFSLFTTLVIAPGVVSLILAPLFMLMAVRIAKRGLFLIYTILTGLPFLFTGYWFVTLYIIIVGLLGEFLFFRNTENYKNSKSLTIFWPIYSIFWVGMSVIPVWFLSDTYAQTALAGGFSQDYVDSLLMYFSTPSWMALIWGLAIIGGFIGALLGRRLLNKHFKKAGVV